MLYMDEQWTAEFDSNKNLKDDDCKETCDCRMCLQAQADGKYLYMPYWRRQAVRDSFLSKQTDTAKLSSPAELPCVSLDTKVYLPAGYSVSNNRAEFRYVPPKGGSGTAPPKTGKQSSVEEASHHLPPKALLALCKTLHDGAAKYEPERLSEFGGENWRRISKADHYNHAMLHLVKWLSGDRTEDHLSHATARLLFLKELELDTPRD